MNENGIKTGIQKKFFVITVSLIVFICASLVVFFMMTFRRELRFELEKRGLTEVKSLAYDAKYGAITEDQFIINHIISGRINKPDIAYLEINPEAGPPLAKKTRPGYETVFKMGNPVIILENGVEMELLQAENGESVYEFRAVIATERILPAGKKKAMEDAMLFTGDKSKELPDIIGTAKAGFSLNSIHARMTRFVLISMVIIVVVASLSIFISWRFVGRLVKPIREITLASMEISKGDLTRFVDIKSSDEIGRLAESFNKMTADLKLSRDSLVANQTQTENIIRSMHNALFVCSADGAINRVNRALLDLLGYSRDELEGSSVRVITPDDDLSWIADLMERGFISSTEKTFTAKNKRRLLTLFSGSVMNDMAGNAIGIVCVAQDITERKRAENRLKASEERYRTLVNAIPDIVYKIDKRGRFTFVNQCVRTLGYEPEELLGKHFSIIVAKEDAPGIVKSIALRKLEGKETGENIPIKLFDERRSGKRMTRNLEARLAPKAPENRAAKKPGIIGLITAFGERNLIEANGTASGKGGEKPISTVGIIRDITEKTLLQTEAIRASQLAAIGELAACVAHEMNNPLNSIIMCAQLLLDKKLDDETSDKSIKRILIDSERAAVVVKSLLSFTRDSDGDANYYSLHSILTETLTLTTTQTKRDGINVKVDFDPGMPEIKFHPQRLQQVFLNLINNARYALNEKYQGEHKDKSIEITGKIVVINNARYAQITFHDNGVGMPKSETKNALLPFYTTKPRGKGTGLGLSICDKIITDLHGMFKIESIEGRHTNAIIHLPADSAKAQGA